MTARAPAHQATEKLTLDARRVRAMAASLGNAIQAAGIEGVSPPLARGAAAAENLYGRIESEFGLLTSSEAGTRMGSRAKATRNLAVAAHQNGRLLGLARRRYTTYPGFQFDDHGARPVIAELIAVARAGDRSDVGVIQWLMSPSTYLDDRRPVDILDEPDLLVETARSAFGVQW